MATFIPDPVRFRHLTHGQGGLFDRFLMAKGQDVQRLARLQVGVDTHELRKSIHVNRRTGALGPEISIGSTVDHALVHHQGASPHIIRAKPGKFLRFPNRRGGGGVVIVPMVHHPGHEGNPYLTKSLDIVMRTL